ncbi:undecaprenyl-diphosphate phosphatase [Silvibacterium sp.]|uniref:undecaprenyl-diphosphate phosphatase n=1 Tax=Silvibacterium sp. TaxID=1964179 RepID=UPI0039E57049
MPILKVILLAIVQGLAELLPVSSSAHVVVAEKLMGLDPSSPQMTLLLVMLHTGTMFAVIVYFWKQWKDAYFTSAENFKRFLVNMIWATVLTGAVGYPLKKVIEKVMFHGAEKAELELLFSRLDLIAYALFAAGLLILFAGLRERGKEEFAEYRTNFGRSSDEITLGQAGIMGAVQGLALPFRGFSRSGTTISAGLLVGASRERADRFSFAMAVVLTPAVIAAEAHRLLKAAHEASATGAPIDLHASLTSSLIGMVLSFFAGLAALKWLSAWLEGGKWYLFGIYCLIASVVVFLLHHHGY